MGGYYWDLRFFPSALSQTVLLFISFFYMEYVSVSDPLTTSLVVLLQVALLLTTLWVFVEFVLWTIFNMRRLIRLGKRGI